jgi:hypothetical protein
MSSSCPSCGGSRWVRYLVETKKGTFEEAFTLCASCPDDAPPGEPFPTNSKDAQGDLWPLPKAFDYSLEENAHLWKRAEVLLKGLCEMTAAWNNDPVIRNDALMVALTDCRERVREEIGRAESEIERHQEWATKQLERGGSVWGGRKKAVVYRTGTL